MAVASEKTISELNSMLRGEISAAETYKQALDKLQKDAANRPEAERLREIELEHGDAIRQLRSRIKQLGGEPENQSGAWGVWAKTVEGSAQIFGDTGALKALKEGEEHGLKDYRRTLDKSELDTETRTVLRPLMEQQEQHIAILDQLLATK